MACRNKVQESISKVSTVGNKPTPFVTSIDKILKAVFAQLAIKPSNDRRWKDWNGTRKLVGICIINFGWQKVRHKMIRQRANGLNITAKLIGGLGLTQIQSRQQAAICNRWRDPSCQLIIPWWWPYESNIIGSIMMVVRKGHSKAKESLATARFGIWIDWIIFTRCKIFLTYPNVKLPAGSNYQSTTECLMSIYSKLTVASQQCCMMIRKENKAVRYCTSRDAQRNLKSGFANLTYPKTKPSACSNFQSKMGYFLSTHYMLKCDRKAFRCMQWAQETEKLAWRKSLNFLDTGAWLFSTDFDVPKSKDLSRLNSPIDDGILDVNLLLST